MMKPPFKASDSAKNVIHAPWFDMSTVCLMASLNMTLKLKYISYVMPTFAIYHLALGLGDYKPDITLVT